jgi:hypothetical protein
MGARISLLQSKNAERAWILISPKWKEETGDWRKLDNKQIQNLYNIRWSNQGELDGENM